VSFFTLEKTSGKARAGVVKTAHGDIPTPIFMPVGTRASVKTMSQEDLEKVGAKIILGNTYHLYLRPGHELIEKVGGGLHGFMSWKGPILTDSGGYQVFSLSHMNKVSEEGVTFQSHLDGSRHMLSPEKSMEIQRALGSDIVMAFDECPELPAAKERLRQSMELTLRWARRCKEVKLKDHQHLFGIVQGGLELDLRLECLERLREIDFPGYAIGGLSVGEKSEEMRELLEQFAHQMPADRPRYLMGVGKPLDILDAVRRGVDMFDCVLPTRNARNGQFLTERGPLNIKKERFKEDQLAPDPECPCAVCARYSRAYIRHLFIVGEYLGGQLITHHNIFFYLRLMRRVREAILADSFDEFYQKFYNSYLSNAYA
jgi:queuine tRNA-ribosyltransferase